MDIHTPFFYNINDEFHSILLSYYLIFSQYIAHCLVPHCLLILYKLLSLCHYPKHIYAQTHSISDPILSLLTPFPSPTIILISKSYFTFVQKYKSTSNRGCVPSLLQGEEKNHPWIQLSSLRCRVPKLDPVLRDRWKKPVAWLPDLGYSSTK